MQTWLGRKSWGVVQHLNYQRFPEVVVVCKTVQSTADHCKAPQLTVWQELQYLQQKAIIKDSEASQPCETFVPSTQKQGNHQPAATLCLASELRSYALIIPGFLHASLPARIIFAVGCTPLG